MGSDKKTWQETTRWLRIGALSVSALSPFINILLARLRANVEAEEAVIQLKKDELEGVAQSAQHKINLDWQERLQAVGATVNDLMIEMQDSPYGQRLQQQSDDLRERGSQLSQAVAERSSQLTHDLAERSNDLRERGSKLSQNVADRSSQLTQELADRSSKLTQELAGRGGEISQELAQRSRRAQRQLRRELSGQDRNFWILLGFGSGLVATAIITFVLIRRRLQRAVEEEPPIQLLYNDTDAKVESAITSRGNIYSVGANGTKLEAQTTTTNSAAPETDVPTLPTNETSQAVTPVEVDADTTSPTTETSGASSPTDASFVGVSSTRQYYPVETPLDQLHTADEESLDVVYFSSEDEAQRQGFSAANR